MDLYKEEGFQNQRFISYPIDEHLADTQLPLIAGTYPTELGYFPEAKYHYKDRKIGAEQQLLLYCLKGKGTVTIGQMTFALEARQAIWIAKGTPHIYYADDQDPWSILWLHFQLTESDDYPLKNQPTPQHSLEKSAVVEKHFSELFTLCEKEYTTHNTICISKLIPVILTDIFFLPDRTNTDHQSLLQNQAINYMLDHLTENLTISKIADHLEISESYLSLIFNKYQGSGPIDYLLDLRVGQASKLLRISNLKVYEIAHAVGYSDPYYFSRLFKKKTGMSPKEYRHQL